MHNKIDISKLPVVLCCLSLFFFLDCTGRDVLTVSNVLFDDVRKVEYKEVECDFDFSYPVSLSLMDSFLIVQDEKGHDHFFHVLNSKNWNLHSEFAKKGNGPGELLYPTYSPQVVEGVFQIYDYNLNRIYFYVNDGDRIILEKSVNIHTDILESSFVRQCVCCMDFYVLTGEKGLFEEKQLAVFDDKLNYNGSFIEYLVLENSKELDDLMQKELYNIHFIKITPNLKHLVFASYKSGVLQVFNMENAPHAVEKTTTLLLTPLVNGDKETIYGFEDLYVTDSYIYTLHNGSSPTENPLFTKEIKVFDMLGNPIVKYEVGIDMRCIAVNEEKKRAYTIAYTEEKGFFLIEIML
ncbi:hypothetical protein M2101_001357 [Parabacteroides sp. PM5-20]|uniref:BF3164 family lipoprotein n=1 Tax=unclassified Parabacteroides TaxID=2649774 RepID=UPI0013D71583|nr:MULTISPECIES: BF3164 family lipoprotein [unclassified Parabacteroides]MDH6534681.1 hypothetical protein [Parabacteroides sp. PM5-20]